MENEDLKGAFLFLYEMAKESAGEQRLAKGAPCDGTCHCSLCHLEYALTTSWGQKNRLLKKEAV